MDPKNRLNEDERRVNLNISRVRSRKARLNESHVTLAHGAGGKASAALIEAVFYSAYDNPVLNQQGDSAVIPLAELVQAHGSSLAFSTDSYVVSPIIFPGGNIGELAINGTVNDLAVAGAQPKLISVGFILEEGLAITELREIVQSMREAAEKAGVHIVAGDTKVVPKGAGDKVYINTSGIGVIPPGRFSTPIQPGDRIIVSGPIADHGMAVMLARGDLAISAPIESDTQSVHGMTEALFANCNPRWMRDATRGGLATVMNELAKVTGFGVALEDVQIPVRDMTRAACDMLGIDPLYVANEGTFVAVVPEADVENALSVLPEGKVIGTVVEEPAAAVVLKTGFGGTRMVDMLVGDPLPRIC
ncbi:hydrogenase expression/formation protein HypE [Corynebacterium freiburgense]|uniref:hydrogenase expression/formation protein HypE n=1 Tax=Corynebacterium freiburgense TaxID=556548 RepID=UPI00041241BD|nr:hydrogenase expression/formation protein HypE [Corynebacterium freiburgense]WJZ01863.1 Hydrogenase isoenzymes formation protein HypE [Corynebacterium freiburgense]